MAARGILTPAGWLGLGLCPEPQTTGQTIRYHIGHGLVMQYPFVSILRFAWRNRGSFTDDLNGGQS